MQSQESFSVSATEDRLKELFLSQWSSLSYSQKKCLREIMSRCQLEMAMASINKYCLSHYLDS
ncbi:hypothetical protein [Prochlorococcus sp. MIT 1223]|uniref:hypothetical protein n=1 Tax=Prochlorococcus sp. MIT 1223 TaxID=3096217 RepID=UPI002A75779B|nr:hypothetical protein [Prochlorococcus sp. MIT 1223]